MKTFDHKEKIKKLSRLRNILISAIVFLIIVIFFFILNILNTNKISWGTKVAGISVGGLSPQAAEQKLIEASEQFLKMDLFLIYKNSPWQANLERLGIEIDVSNTTKIAFERGHQRNKFLKNAFWQLLSLFGYDSKLVWQINEEELENFLKENLSSIHQPAQNSTLIYDDEKKDFITTPSKEGVVINKIRLKKDLAKIVNNFRGQYVQLELIEDYPEVIESETKDAYQKVKSVFGKLPFSLVVSDDKEKKEIGKVNREEFLLLIDFKPVLDSKNPDNKILGLKLNQEKAKEYLISLAPLINHEPIDAKFTFKNNRVIAFALSEEGIRLEIENNIPVLAGGILTDKKEIQLRIEKIQPKITTESINNLGITALLAKGVSNFSGSPNSRIHNIGIGAAKFNGVLIKPEEEFSFNSIIGEIGPEQGYEPELVIKKDKTIPEYGGGLCQVSTTMFRAAVNAGLKIIERYPHAFPVKYYNPQGFDATIYPPSPDLKFINNTPAHILIQTKVVGYDLIFELYGTNDGRKIVIDGPYQYDTKEDGSMKAKITQKVYDKNDNLIIDKTFNSAYKSPSLYPVERNPLE
ncbi:MAG: VanW family protein [Patescibacteria group bacterium]